MTTPTIHRPLTGDLVVALPRTDVTKDWFRTALGRPAAHVRQLPAPEGTSRWALGRPGLAEIAHAIAAEFGGVELVMDYYAARACSHHCIRSKNAECFCSCLGLAHGGTSLLNRLPVVAQESIGGHTVRARRVLTAEQSAARMRDEEPQLPSS